MRENAFREYLISRGMSQDEINSQITFISHLEEQLKQIIPSWTLEDLNGESSQLIVDALIDRGENSLNNLQAIARYAKTVKNEQLYNAIFIMLDGCEPMEQLYDKLGAFAGVDLRDIIFEEMPLPPLGISRREKSRYTYRLINRMETIFEESTTREILQNSLRILPEEYFSDDKEIFCNDCRGDIEQFLLLKRQRFIETLEDYRDREALFFGQKVDNEVIDFVQSNVQIGGGIREGNVILETKIPYNAKAYLAEHDPDRKRYHYCHCPWARDSLLRRTFTVPPTFCQCSAGFHKKRYETIFDQPIRAEVLQSVLNGDPVCQFEIELPEAFNW